MRTNAYFCFPIRALALGVVITFVLGGCAMSMPNSSNQTLEITRAQVRGDRAILDMRIDNPSDMNVNVHAVRWSLRYGPLPTAEGMWQLAAPVASKGNYRFTKEVVLTSPALDPNAENVELTGTLEVTTEGDMGNMGLNGAGFVSTAKVEH